VCSTKIRVIASAVVAIMIFDESKSTKFFNPHRRSGRIMKDEMKEVGEDVIYIRQLCVTTLVLKSSFHIS